MHFVVSPHDKPLEYQTRCLNGQWVIDLAKITKHDADLKISDTCGLAILESISEIGPLESLQEPDAPDDRRVPGTDLPDMDEKSSGPDSSERFDNLFDTIGEPHEISHSSSSEILSDELRSRSSRGPRAPSSGDLNRIP